MNTWLGVYRNEEGLKEDLQCALTLTLSLFFIISIIIISSNIIIMFASLHSLIHHILEIFNSLALVTFYFCWI